MPVTTRDNLHIGKYYDQNKSSVLFDNSGI